MKLSIYLLQENENDKAKTLREMSAFLKNLTRISDIKLKIIMESI